MPDWNAILNGNRRDEAIHGRPDGQPSSSALAIDVRRREKQRERNGIAQNRYRQERVAKGVACRAGPQALQDLLNHGTACHEIGQVVLAQRSSSPASEEFNPHGSVDQDHLDCRARRAPRRGRSWRMIARSPLQMPVPKNCGMVWILFKRMTSPRAVLTAAEYVLAPKTLVACSSNCSSNTRFVRRIHIV